MKSFTLESLLMGPVPVNVAWLCWSSDLLAPRGGRRSRDVRLLWFRGCFHNDAADTMPDRGAGVLFIQNAQQWQELGEGETVVWDGDSNLLFHVPSLPVRQVLPVRLVLLTP